MTKLTIFILLLLAAVTVPPALIHGQLMHRWQAPAVLASVETRVSKLPRHIGDWKSATDAEPLTADVQAELGVGTYVHRTYENDWTGDQITVLLMAGKAGPLVRHPPEICYQQRANRVVDRPRLIEFTDDGVLHQFRLIKFRSASLAATDFHVAFGFLDDSAWNCPQQPRIAYGGKPALTKLQVLTRSPNLGPDGVPVSIADFLSQLVSIVNNDAN